MYYNLIKIFYLTSINIKRIEYMLIKFITNKYFFK